MAYLAAILVSAALLSGFLALTYYEAARGTRVLSGVRSRLDRGTSRALFVVSHVDWGAFANHLVRAGMARVLHDIAHGALVTVRVIERVLTRIVKYLRTRRHEAPHANEERRRFTLSSLVSQFRSAVAPEPPPTAPEEKPERRQTFDISS